MQEIISPLDLLVTDTLHQHYRFSIRVRYSESLDSAIHWIHLSRIKSSGVTSVQFVRDWLFDLAKYLLAEDSGDDLRQMDYSDVWLDVVV